MKRMSQQSPHATASTRYGAVAQIFHWLTAVGVIASFTIGLIMVDMAFSPLQLKLFSWHKWIGVCVFALLLLRLAWRVGHPPPPLPTPVRTRAEDPLPYPDWPAGSPRRPGLLPPWPRDGLSPRPHITAGTNSPTRPRRCRRPR